MEITNRDIRRPSDEMSIHDILNRIDRADDIEISKILQSLLKRYQRVFPGEEVVFLSVPKHDAKERKRIMESVFLQMDKETE